MTSRSYLSIGDVLTLLRQEFPDVTISKIRFLESQGLVNPERTPSGYRKFYEHDVERLRWVLRQQREHFLPLKVIKDRLDDGSEAGATPEASPGTAPADGVPVPAVHPVEEPVLVGQRIRTDVTEGSAPSDGVAEGVLLSGPEVVRQVAASSGSGPVGLRLAPDESSAAGTGEAPGRAGLPTGAHPAAPEATDPEARDESGPVDDGWEEPVAKTAEGNPAAPPPRRSPSARRGKAEPVPVVAEVTVSESRPEEPAVAPGGAPADDDGASLSVEELSVACGLDVAVLIELQEFGLLVPRAVAGVPYFDEEALAVAVLAARFAQFGIEPRHLRLYKNAADREAGFVEQILLPLVRQRNPAARARAQQTADDLAGLGQQLRATLLRQALSDLLGV